MPNYVLLICVSSLSLIVHGAKDGNINVETSQDYWRQDAQKYLYKTLRTEANEALAKGVILFLGDGMGMTTVTATRFYKGQKKRESGETEKLAFEKFPHVSLSKTYGVDRQTSDSANTATAYLCGVKANFGTIGVDGRVRFEDCESSLDPSTRVASILEWAHERGLSSGVVTTTRVTHATPAGAYAHTPSRKWEARSPHPKCRDIAAQLVTEAPGRDISVIMGGGRRQFLPKQMTDVDGVPGNRNDSRNLLDKWLKMKRNDNVRAQMVFSVEELRALDVNKVDHLMGLFHADHLPYVADRGDLKREYPTLPHMVEVAINILKKNKRGFFLLVEGGRIDTAHHNNWARKALEEGVEFDEAVATARKMTSEEDTLIVVTADHSHTFTVGGNYPLRGNSIVGLGGVSDVDNRTFTTLGYHSGPGYKPLSRNRNLTQMEVTHKEYQQDTLVPLGYETHGAEDVPVFASGPMSHLFHGVHEQSYIPYVMGYAACIGPNQEKCSGGLPAVHHTGWNAAMCVAMVVFVLGRTVL